MNVLGKLTSTIFNSKLQVMLYETTLWSIAYLGIIFGTCEKHSVRPDSGNDCRWHSLQRNTWPEGGKQPHLIQLLSHCSMLCGGPQCLGKRSVTQLQFPLIVKSKAEGNSNHGPNFLTRSAELLKKPGSEVRVHLLPELGCECRMRTSSTCLPKCASPCASSRAPQWIWLSLGGGAARGVVAVGDG